MIVFKPAKELYHSPPKGVERAEHCQPATKGRDLHGQSILTPQITQPGSVGDGGVGFKSYGAGIISRAWAYSKGRRTWRGVKVRGARQKVEGVLKGEGPGTG